MKPIRTILICLAFFSLASDLSGREVDSGDLFPIRQNGKWGYIDKTGKVVIDFKFGHAEPFYNGLALGGDTFLGEIGYIDRTGNYIWQPAK